MNGFESPSRAAATAAAGEDTRRDSTLIEQPWSFPVTSIQLFKVNQFNIQRRATLAADL